MNKEITKDHFGHIDVTKTTAIGHSQHHCKSDPITIISWDQTPLGSYLTYRWDQIFRIIMHNQLPTTIFRLIMHNQTPPKSAKNIKVNTRKRGVHDIILLVINTGFKVVRDSTFHMVKLKSCCR